MLVQIATLLIDVISAFFVFLLLARFHFQWLRVPFRNQLGELIVVTTNWIVRPARRVIPALAGLDLASWIAAWLVQGIALWALYALRGWSPGQPGEAFALVAALALLDLVRYSLYLLVFAVVMLAVLSWMNPYSPVMYLFDASTRPFLRPLRRFIRPIGSIDLSPLVLLVALQVLLIPLWSLHDVLERLL